MTTYVAAPVLIVIGVTVVFRAVVHTSIINRPPFRRDGQACNQIDRDDPGGCCTKRPRAEPQLYFGVIANRSRCKWPAN